MIVDVWGTAEPVNATCHGERPPDVSIARHFTLPEAIVYTIAACAQSRIWLQ